MRKTNCRPVFLCEHLFIFFKHVPEIRVIHDLLLTKEKENKIRTQLPEDDTVKKKKEKENKIE